MECGTKGTHSERRLNGLAQLAWNETSRRCLRLVRRGRGLGGPLLYTTFRPQTHLLRCTVLVFSHVAGRTVSIVLRYFILAYPGSGFWVQDRNKTSEATAVSCAVAAELKQNYR